MKSIHSYSLFILVLLAALLRFYNYPELPLTQDELSALVRTKADSLSMLINNGVLPDTHPAGVQVFMYYWTKWFGYDSMAVKLPFILMGLACIPLIYQLGKIWFNRTVGLLAASFIASMQYIIMYHQMARPYATGMFLCLWMFVHWSYLIFKQKEKWHVHHLMFALSATLCCYNHHFSMLMVGICSIIGFFWLPKSQRKRYALSVLVIPLLYLPHLPVFFKQLGYGGIGAWLGKPEPDFLFSYISYIFHHSWYVGLLVLLLLLIGIRNLWQVQAVERRSLSKRLILCLALFLVSFVIGYLYSLIIDPVIQYSVLIFAFPFLLFAFLGILPEMRPKKLTIAVSLILAVNIVSLIFERKHYTLFYQDVNKEFLLECEGFNERYEGQGVSFLTGASKYLSYLANLEGLNSNFTNIDSISPIAFKEILCESSTDYCLLGLRASKDFAYYSVLCNEFPYEVSQKNYHGGALFIRSRIEQSSDQSNEPILEDTASFIFNPTVEWNPPWNIELSRLFDKKPGYIQIEAELEMGEGDHDIILVGSITKRKGEELWGGSTLDITPCDSSSRFILRHSINLAEYNFSPKRSSLKVYVWNKGRTDFTVLRLSVSVLDGNPLQYGFHNKI